MPLRAIASSLVRPLLAAYAPHFTGMLFPFPGEGCKSRSASAIRTQTWVYTEALQK